MLIASIVERIGRGRVYLSHIQECLHWEQWSRVEGKIIGPPSVVDIYTLLSGHEIGYTRVPIPEIDQ